MTMSTESGQGENMVDYKRLREEIKANGISKVCLAKKMSITSTSLQNKLNGATQFRESDMYVLYKALHLEPMNLVSIFFADNVHSETTGESNG